MLALARMYSGDFELAAEGFDRAWALWESIAKPATGLHSGAPGNLSGHLAVWLITVDRRLGMEPLVSGLP